MKESIYSIKLSRLKNETHTQFHENVTTLLETVTAATLGIEPLYALYRTAFNDELASLDVIIKSEMTAKISEQDRVRDEVFRGFSDTVKGFRNHFDAGSRVAANLLWNVFLHYGNIAAKSFDDQTAAVNDIIREFRQRPELVEALETLGITSWCDKMEEENQRFHALMMDRFGETTGRTTLRMKNTRIETDKYYRAMVAHFENQLLTGNSNPVFLQFIADLNAIAKRFKDFLAADFGRKNAAIIKKSTPPAPTIDTPATE